MQDSQLDSLRLPPQNIEAEQSLLGALLIDKEAIIRVADTINPQDFYKNTHALIFEAMQELFTKQEPIDILSLTSRLEDKKQIESIGGRAYLMQLSNVVPTSSHVVHYAKIVQNKALLRRLLTAASGISELVYKEDEDVEVVLDKAEKELFHVSQNYSKQAFVPIKNVLESAFDRIDELHREKGKLRGIPTGFPALDNYLSGLQKSDLVILAARPSVGKTSLALDIARLAAKSGKSVGLFSLEMSKEQLVDRLICTEANIDLWKMRTGKLTDSSDDFTRIGNALGTLSEIPLYIDDSATSNIMDIRTKARRLQMERGLDMIVIDYLQLLESRTSYRSSDNRVQEVAEITRGLKAVARELDIPVLALSQLSRAVENSKPAIPKLAHLRESGSIEQDADVVMFIYRKSADRNYRPEDLDPQERNIAEIHIAKHRNGPTGEIKLFFDEQRVCFRSLEQKREAPAPLPAKEKAQIEAPTQTPTQAPIEEDAPPF
ncbi:replicative DNA helicase [Candidatus Parcubacteria bacterium]|nr:replicative DNA helicase [Patescibacteria group bacterium]MCG2694381.1 replicative DNA helicase [Candidatus Parcubacteria bacterium]